MARYDNKANVGYGRVSYPDQVHHPVFFDMEGGKHAVVGYAKTRNYVATSEQVAEFRHESRGIRDEPILIPLRSSVHDRLHKGDGFFPKAHDHVGHDQNMVFPWERDASESNRPAVHDQSKGLPWNRDANSPNRPAIHDQSKGLPWNRDANNTNRSTVRDQSRGLPWNRDASDPGRLTVQNKGLPRNKDAKESNRLSSPPSKDHYYNPHKYGKNNHSDSSDDEDDVICEDVVCYVKDKLGGSKSINHLKQEDYNNEEHTAYNEYAPTKDSYYKTSYDNDEKHKGKGHIPSSYTVPITTPPRKDTYYETSTYNNRPMVDGPKPIKTRTGVDFPKENARNPPISIGMQQPQYNGSPRKDGYQETIPNKASPRAGTIDSREAAMKYKGVLLSN